MSSFTAPKAAGACGDLYGQVPPVSTHKRLSGIWRPEGVSLKGTRLVPLYALSWRTAGSRLERWFQWLYTGLTFTEATQRVSGRGEAKRRRVDKWRRPSD
ncbi:hypothetical protein SKAU_G00007160 [Synaphobranchus kaupii]|uniref:Uncharacterized protein n=1 Tax=Synaphobranchus kaupii TaxID=118154 RepID=A0A9Q1GAG0_SYNKA|nr:hypothetical protein SKAU_G00007160 [Synaphobranchus kaupii]